MCWAAWAWEASTSSMSGGEKSEANCTAMKMAAKSSQVASVEGADCGRWRVRVRIVVTEDGIATRIAAVSHPSDEDLSPGTPAGTGDSGQWTVDRGQWTVDSGQ